MKMKSWLTAAAALCVAAGTTFAAPPSDAALAEKVREYEQTMAKTPRAEQLATRTELIKKLLGDETFAEYSSSQIETVLGLVVADEALRDRAIARLAELKAQESPEGLNAELVHTLMQMYARRGSPTADDVKRMLNDPRLVQLVSKGQGLSIFSLLGSVRGGGLSDSVETLMKLTRALPETLAPGKADSIANLYTTLAYTVPNPSEQLASLQSRALAYLDADIKSLKGDDAKATSPQIASLEKTRDRLAVINGAAPEIEFMWYSEDGSVTKLSDLKGKVVIIDFWATWCGPCISAFPKVRHLAEHYNGYPVEIVGVTSIQGSHYRTNPQTNEREKIDTKDDTQKEFTLMTEFMKELNMTWPVGFSKENVFDPRYGVYGIPHIAIIDPAGKVRVNGLNPHGLTDVQEHALIDTILKEFNLATPDFKPHG
ncbi:MAG: TlpA family protein disulfide reductase [Phycisphaeraceae bacterium]|nr:TlpA family protein disulfide reductase [Phycisphaeraceae bacterium]MCW5763933.1 TlpA family protein disulfide reductase [Phycisphaeraceae bacterium]